MGDATSLFGINASSATPRLLRSVTPELAWIVLVLSLGLTVLAYCLVHFQMKPSSTDAARLQAIESAAAIKARLNVSAQLLRSTAAMLMLDRTVQRGTWLQYQNNLAHQGWPKELLQLGYAQHIASSEKVALSTAMRADAMPNYQIHPLHDQAEHAPILFIAPATGLPAMAEPGFDLLSASATKQTLAIATDTGAIAFHSLDDAPTQPSGNGTTALLVLPLFPGSAVPSTVALRQQHVIGFVFAFVKIDEILRSVSAPQYRPIRMTELPAESTHQRTLASAQQTMFANGDTLAAPLDLFGSHWQVGVAPILGPSHYAPDGTAHIVAIGGCIISALLFAVLRLLAAIQLASHSNARVASRKIRQLQNQLSALISCSDHAIIVIDRRQRIMRFNSAAETIFSVCSTAAIGLPLSRFLPHRLKGARRADIAALNADGGRLSMYRLHNQTTELACRYHGEQFPFEAIIVKCGRWGQSTFMILLKDLTQLSHLQSAQTNTVAPPTETYLLDALPTPQTATSEALQAVHFELSVGESVCESTFIWLAGELPNAAQFKIGEVQAGTLQHAAQRSSHPHSINEFITTRIHADDRAAVKQQWKRAFRSGCEVDCVYRMLLADGDTQLVRHWMTPAGDQHQQRRFAGVLHQLQQEVVQKPPEEFAHNLAQNPYPEHSSPALPVIEQQPHHEAATQAPHQQFVSVPSLALSPASRSMPLPANASSNSYAMPFAHHNDRRRSQPNAIETGRLYRQLQCRIMTFETAREEQQKRLARDMHDDFGQLLTAMKMDLIVLQTQLAKNDHRLSQQLGDVGDLVDAMVVSVRRIIANLPPEHLDQQGLVKSLELLAAAHAKRHRINCRLHVAPALLPLDSVMITPVYRIVQEALNNVAKHARATEIDIRLEQRGDRLHLSVTDNGDGIAASQLQDTGGFGLIGMRERVNTLNGEMTIDTASGIGTTVRIVIPLDIELAA